MTRHFGRWLLALALLSLPAIAQNRLEPVTPVDDAISRGRDANLRTVFREAWEPRVEARAFVYPAFAPEYAVGLRRGAHGHEIFLLEPSLQISRYSSVERLRAGEGASPSRTREQTLRDAEEMSRHLPPNVSDVPVARCSVAVDEETAAAVIRAWRRMLQQIEPNRDGVYMFDGVHYYFSMTISGRVVEGKTWRGMPPELAEAMADYCSANSRSRRIALGAGVPLAALSLVPAMLLLSAGFRRITGRRIRGMDRLGSAFRRNFGMTWAAVSTVLVALLVYAAFSGGSSREVLGLAQVIASAR
jgi:hypothetical protein